MTTGPVLMGESSESYRKLKKEIVLADDKKKLSTKWLLAIAALTTIAVLAGIYVATPKGSAVRANREKVSEGVDYTIRNVEMTDIKSEMRDGYVAISLADLKKNKLVAFRYPLKKIKDARGKEKPLPLMAMISPSGKLITAVAVCEPCRSERFHTEPDGTLTCNVCNTKWDLETFEGISGGCPNYPPVELPHKIQNGKILIEERLLQNWKPRVV